MRGYLPFRFAVGSSHEPGLSKVMKNILAGRDGTFVDVGANLAQTLVKVLEVAPDRHYCGFEPQISCCAQIEQFIRDNGIRQAQIIPVALSNANGTMPFYTELPDYVMGSLLADHRERQAGKASRTTFVNVRGGDEILTEAGIVEIAVIKIDVEGAELLVLQGLKRAIAKRRPAIMLEVLPNFVGEERVMQDAQACAINRQNSNAIWSLLAEHGYAMNVIDEAGEMKPVTRFALDDPREFVSFNYIAMPR